MRRHPWAAWPVCPPDPGPAGRPGRLTSGPPLRLPHRGPAHPSSLRPRSPHRPLPLPRLLRARAARRAPGNRRRLLSRSGIANPFNSGGKGTGAQEMSCGLRKGVSLRDARAVGGTRPGMGRLGGPRSAAGGGGGKGEAPGRSSSPGSPRDRASRDVRCRELSAWSLHAGDDGMRASAVVGAPVGGPSRGRAVPAGYRAPTGGTRAIRVINVRAAVSAETLPCQSRCKLARIGNVCCSGILKGLAAIIATYR
jgi:hypothetical protein